MQDMVVDILLLDLRDEDDFTQYHLRGGARSWFLYLVLPTMFVCPCKSLLFHPY